MKEFSDLKLELEGLLVRMDAKPLYTRFPKSDTIPTLEDVRVIGRILSHINDNCFDIYEAEKQNVIMMKKQEALIKRLEARIKVLENGNGKKA